MLVVDSPSTQDYRDVVVLRWPEDAAEVERHAELHSPRLLLVGGEADPPSSNPCEQDWVRLPAEERDIAARLTCIRDRASRHQAVPSIDDTGRLHLRGHWVPLSGIERRLTGELVMRFGAVVSPDDLIAAAWPGVGAPANTLRVQMTRLRHRIRELGLEIKSVRGSGYVLEELHGGAL